MKNVKNNLIESAPFIIGGIVIIAISLIWLIDLFKFNPYIY
jgi:hypothetical protein